MSLVWQRKLYYENRQYLIKLLGSKCANCGVDCNLEFDHIDPNKRNFRLGGNLKRSLKTLINEAKLCQLLCKDCHLAKTKGEYLLSDKVKHHKIKHGTVNEYVNYKCRCNLCRLVWANRQREYIHRPGNLEKHRLREKERRSRLIS